MTSLRSSQSQPFLSMVTEPESKVRFRYGSELGKHGGILGKSPDEEAPKKKSKSKKVYPTVKLENYEGEKAVVIAVSLYTENKEKHPFKLKNARDDGRCYQDLDKNHTATFKDLEIMSELQKEVEKILMDRKMGNLGCDIKPSVRKQFQKCESVKKKAKEISKVVRLCFEAFVKDKCVPLCSPLFSEPIYDSRSTEKGDLKILRISHYSGGCNGGNDVIIINKKVQKDTIKVLFYELDESKSKIIWQAFGSFTSADVYYQVAIAFKTPTYRQNIDKIVNVCLMRNDEYSEPVEFRYIPDTDLPQSRKRQKLDIDQPRELQENKVSSMLSPSSSSNGASSDYFMEDVSIQSNNLGTFYVQSKDVSSCQYLLDENVELNPTTQQNYSLNDLEETPADIIDMIEKLGNDPEFYTLEDANSWDLLNLEHYPLEDTYNQPTRIQVDAGVISPIHSMTPLQAYTVEEIQNQSMPLINLDFDDGFDSSSSESLVEMAPCGQMGEIEQSMADVCIKDNVSQTCLNKNFDKEDKSSQKVNKTENNRSNKLGNHQNYFRLLSLRDEMGNTLLHLAVLYNKNITTLLKTNRILHSNIVNLQNDSKKTAINLATEKNKARFVWELLRSDADPNIIDVNGNNCLHIASLNNFSDCMNELLAISRSYVGVNSFNYEGLAPLHLAVRNTSVDCFKLLMEVADVNVLDKKGGSSPLHFAVEMQPFFVSILLKQNDINVDIQNFRGDSPLHVACAVGNTHVVQLLLQSGADPSLKNYKQYLEVSEEENSEDETDDSATHSSLANSSKEISKNKEIDGQTALDIATDPKILEMLKKAIQSKDKDKLTDPSQMEERLCRLLDNQLQRKDWENVVMYMGLDERYLDSFLVCSSSPTKSVMTYLKRTYGDSYMDTLQNCFEMAGLNDALETVLQRHN